MKSLLITLLCTSLSISAVPYIPKGTPAHIVASINKSLTTQKTTIIVKNNVDEIGYLIEDFPEESIEKVNAEFASAIVKVNGQVIKLGESKEMQAGSMVLVSIELPAHACSEFLKKTNIFKRVAFAAARKAVRLKAVFLVEVDPENPEVDLLTKLVDRLDKWLAKNPNIDVKFNVPFTFLVTLS